VSDVTDLSILEDYDHDAPETTDTICKEMDQDILLGNDLDQQVAQLLSSAIAIDTLGMSKTSFAILKSSDLLSGTSLDALGTENFSTTPGDDPESQMAVEALLDKMKEKAGAWSARILNLTTKISTTIVDLSKSLWSQISEKVSALNTKAWDKAHAVTQTMKAHPYKTVAAVAVAAAAAIGIIGFIMNGMSGAYANQSALKSFMYRIQDMVKGIKWPFGSVASDVIEQGGSFKFATKVTRATTVALESESVVKLGWTQSAVRAVSGQVGRFTTTLTSSASKFGGKVVDVLKMVNNNTGDGMAGIVEGAVKGKTQSTLGGWAAKEVVKRLYNTALWAVVGLVVFLLKEVVLKAYNVIKDTFSTLKTNVKTA
jgi:hypothetical protein